MHPGACACPQSNITCIMQLEHGTASARRARGWAQGRRTGQPGGRPPPPGLYSYPHPPWPRPHLQAECRGDLDRSVGRNAAPGVGREQAAPRVEVHVQQVEHRQLQHHQARVPHQGHLGTGGWVVGSLVGVDRVPRQGHLKAAVGCLIDRGWGRREGTGWGGVRGVVAGGGGGVGASGRRNSGRKGWQWRWGGGGGGCGGRQAGMPTQRGCRLAARASGRGQECQALALTWTLKPDPRGPPVSSRNRPVRACMRVCARARRARTGAPVAAGRASLLPTGQAQHTHCCTLPHAAAHPRAAPSRRVRRPTPGPPPIRVRFKHDFSSHTSHTYLLNHWLCDGFVDDVPGHAAHRQHERRRRRDAHHERQVAEQAGGPAGGRRPAADGAGGFGSGPGPRPGDNRQGGEGRVSLGSLASP